MLLITWSNDLSVNVKKFDREHMKLIGIVNDLHSAMGSCRGKEAIAHSFGRLIDYTKSHFEAEEQLMETLAYPGYLDHKAQHDELTKTIMHIHNEFFEGKMFITAHVMNLLKDWWSNHILRSDKRYAPYLNDRGIA